MGQSILSNCVFSLTKLNPELDHSNLSLRLSTRATKARLYFYKEWKKSDRRETSSQIYQWLTMGLTLVFTLIFPCFVQLKMHTFPSVICSVFHFSSTKRICLQPTASRENNKAMHTNWFQILLSLTNKIILHTVCFDEYKVIFMVIFKEGQYILVAGILYLLSDFPTGIFLEIVVINRRKKSVDIRARL